MKRLHMHVSVDDLDRSVRFYVDLFAADPVVRKADYAKWMLDDPRVNLAISARGRRAGIDHVGMEVETAAELADVRNRLRRADRPTTEEAGATCCYARSEKSWIVDPSGVRWETFLTVGETAAYGDRAASAVGKAYCCAPASTSGACC